MNLPRQTLGQWLLNERCVSGHTQKELASICGFKTPQFVSNWERGISYPSFESIKPLAKAFRMKKEKLVEMIFECKMNELYAEEDTWIKRLK